MLLQLASWMYVDKEATLLWAVAVMLVSELLVEYMWLLLLLLWWWWLLLLLWFCMELYPLICSSGGREVEGNPLCPILFSPVVKTRLHLFISCHSFYLFPHFFPYFPQNESLISFGETTWKIKLQAAPEQN